MPYGATKAIVQHEEPAASKSALGERDGLCPIPAVPHLQAQLNPICAQLNAGYLTRRLMEIMGIIELAQAKLKMLAGPNAPAKILSQGGIFRFFWLGFLGLRGGAPHKENWRC
jgi:hypothetical protein